MDFKFKSLKVRELLSYEGKQLYIPRYQREYSWEKDEIEEFLDDILSGIKLKDGKVENTQYFFSTTLLSGDFDGGKVLEVIDGQQRLTTMTIFLSVLAKSIYGIHDKDSGDLYWGYVMKSDHKGKSYRALRNETTEQFFEHLVQTKKEYKDEPVDEEQKRIKDSYDYFTKELKKRKVKKKLSELDNENDFSNVEYLDILKGIGDQLLESQIICVSTQDEESANSIFKILNAKGRKLASIDLVKNSIFEKLNSIEPTDEANNKWRKIRRNLVSRDEKIDFTIFFRHYWLAKYGRVKEAQIYAEFCKTVGEDKYQEFLDNLEEMSQIYVKIACQNPNDFGKRKEHRFIEEWLSYFNDYFKIKLVRIALLALFSASKNKDESKNKVSTKNLKRILKYLHGFHFAYIALCSKSGNALEPRYSKFAVELNMAKDKDEANKAINDFIKELDKIFPKYSEFEQEFIRLEYSKADRPTNMLSKYVVYNLEKYFSGTDTHPQDGSVEHILSEKCVDELSLNIGNLILLEETINRDAGDKVLTDKMQHYSCSHYSYVSKLREKYCEIVEWNRSIISDRARAMADFYYNAVLERDTSKYKELTIEQIP